MSERSVSELLLLRLYLSAYQRAGREMRALDWAEEVRGPGPLQVAVSEFRTQESQAVVPVEVVEWLAGPSWSEERTEARETRAVWLGAEMRSEEEGSCLHGEESRMGQELQSLAASLAREEERLEISPGLEIPAVPREPYVLGRSGTGGQMVLGLLEGRGVAVRALSSSESVDTAIRRLKDFSRFVHLNLLHYSDFSRHSSGTWFLTRPLCQFNLISYLCGLSEASPSVPGETALETGARRCSFQLLRALAFLHSSTPAIFHGNLKPENCLVDGGGRVQVTDFGLGKLGGGRWEGFSAPLRDPHTAALHPLVWKPGEFFAHQPYTESSDVFGAGLLASFAFSGARAHPFISPQTESLGQLLTALSTRPPSLAHTNPETRALLRQLLRTAAKERSSAEAALASPAFWSPDRKAAFVLALGRLLPDLPCPRLQSFRPDLLAFRAEFRQTFPPLSRRAPSPLSLLTSRTSLLHRLYQLVSTHPHLPRLPLLRPFLQTPSSLS